MGIKKILSAVLFCLAFCASTLSASATKLPDDVWQFVKGQLPSATQRFDSVVVLNESVMYVPLYPAIRNDVEKLAVEYTYPKTTSLKSLPEVFILNNNYVFMKIFKDNKGNFTITKNENLPDKVKLGVMPQDMLVPAGLKIPENLKIIMGDLLIPVRGDNLLITTSDSTVAQDESEDGNIVPIAEMKETKAFFIGNKSKFVLVYDKGGYAPLYEIKLSGLANKMVASPVSKFALCVYYGNKTAEIIDLTNERVLTNIDFEFPANDVALDEKNQIAYVTSAKANSIYMVDLSSASLLKTIKSDREPEKISVSVEDELIAFSDKNNENVYIMNLKQGEHQYAIKKVGNVPNLSSLLIKNGKILATSRTSDKAFVYAISDFENENPTEIVFEGRIAPTPTDAVIFGNKAFILSSKDGIVCVFDFIENKITNIIKLEASGFYSKIKIIPNQRTAIVTGADAKKIVVINLDNSTVVKRANADINIADTVIIDNKPAVKYVPPVKEEFVPDEEL